MFSMQYSNIAIGTNSTIIGGNPHPHNATCLGGGDGHCLLSEPNQMMLSATSRDFNVQSDFQILDAEDNDETEKSLQIEDNDETEKSPKIEDNDETEKSPKIEDNANKKSLDGAMFLRNNSGVFMEIPGKPNVFLDVTQEILGLKDQLANLTEIVQQLYYAPGGPGFHMALSDFEMRSVNNNKEEEEGEE